VSVTDPKASVKVTTHNEAGRISAKMVIPLAGYSTEPITVSLSDSDTASIASQAVGALPPQGTSGKNFQFKTRDDGVQKVKLQNLTPRQPGMFKLIVKTKHWFTAAAANQSATDTTLRVRIGNLCFPHAATRKVD